MTGRTLECCGRPRRPLERLEARGRRCWRYRRSRCVPSGVADSLEDAAASSESIPTTTRPTRSPSDSESMSAPTWSVSGPLIGSCGGVPCGGRPRLLRGAGHPPSPQGLRISISENSRRYRLAHRLDRHPPGRKAFQELASVMRLMADHRRQSRLATLPRRRCQLVGPTRLVPLPAPPLLPTGHLALPEYSGILDGRTDTAAVIVRVVRGTDVLMLKGRYYRSRWEGQSKARDA